jgi:pyruvate ferredoxin oxidoreductase alpha subunit
VETYRTEGAEILLITMGSISETAMTWIDAVRERGKKVGLVRFRMWRPLPVEDFKRAISGAKVLGVIDRHFSPGGAGGPVAQEIKGSMYGAERAPKIVEVVTGLGGRDINFADFDELYGRCEAVLGGAPVPPWEIIQARGGHYGEV